MKKKILVLLFSIIFIIMFKPNVFSDFDNILNIILPLIGTLNIILFMHEKIKQNKMWISIESLFLIGYIIVHFQIPFSHSLGWEPSNPHFIFINKDVVNYATWMSTLAILLWLFGYYLYSLEAKPIHKSKFTIKIKSLKRLQVLILVLFPLFLSLVGNTFLKGNYGGGEIWGLGAVYINILLYMSILLYIALTLLYIPKKKNIIGVLWCFFRFNKITGLFILFYFILFLSAGDRGPIIQISVLILFISTYKHFKITGFQFLFLLILGALLMTVVRFGRVGGTDIRGDANIIVYGLQELRVDESPMNPTLELATSNRILYRAINSVPYMHDYLYGITMMGNLATGIPFLSGVLNRQFNISKVYLSSTQFFTYLGQGQYITWGEGSEILADIYINFGLWGVLLIMLLFGYFVSYISSQFGYKGGIIFIFNILLLVTAIYLNRAPLLSAAQSLFFMFLIYKIIGYERKR